MDLAIAYSHLEQLRREHNKPGHMDDPTWRLKQYKPTKRKVVNRITTERRKLIFPDASELLTIKDSHVEFPGTGKWEDRLYHLYRLRKAVEPTSPEGFVIAEELAKIKQEPDAANLSDTLKFTFEDLEPPPDPQEDFTTYTSYNEQGSGLTITADKVDVYPVSTKSFTMWVYKDFGVGGFTGDYEHLFEMMQHSVGSNYGQAAYWGLGINPDKDARTQSIDGDGSVFIYGYEPLGIATIWDHRQFGEDSDSWSPSTHDLFFVTSDRVGTDITSEWRTVSHSGALSDTLVIAGVATTYRYLYAMTSWDMSSFANWYGYIQNMDLQQLTATGRSHCASPILSI
jgi:hypothetical protein